MADSLWPERNQLLAAMPSADRLRLFPQLELVLLPTGTVLHEPRHELTYAYFPISAMVSLICMIESGDSTEIAAVGREGMLGVSLFMGGTGMLTRAVTTSGGYAYRMNAKLIREEFSHSAAIQMILLRYTQALLTHMAQSAVCNRHHSLEQRLYRWLLISLDRLNSNNIVTTHELISSLLGVRREGVTVAVGRLQVAGIIRYKRGHITVLDRARLEQICCECYDVVRSEFDRLVPNPERSGLASARRQARTAAHEEQARTHQLARAN